MKTQRVISVLIVFAAVCWAMLGCGSDPVDPAEKCAAGCQAVYDCGQFEEMCELTGLDVCTVFACTLACEDPLPVYQNWVNCMLDQCDPEGDCTTLRQCIVGCA